MGATLPDTVHHFGLLSVEQVEEMRKFKLVDESVECFNKLTLVDFSY